mmetsp:Transcript_39778/g.72786  ORF Transcript_39778/g.72786 Transcript_39778/m.72786 type:complete len:210 (-) Transcript_39778:63-692(-)
MPRMLAPRSVDSLSGRSSASPNGSKASLNSYGSATSRQTSLSNNCHGSQFSMRRSSSRNGSAHSSTHSLRQHMQEPSKQNAVWNIEDQGSVSLGSPSLVNSDTSSSGSSSQSSLQPPSVQPPANSDALHRYYAIRRASLQHPTILHPTNSLSGSRSNSFLPSAQIKDEDTWGQFARTENAEKELGRRSSSKLLSITRTYPASFSYSRPS